MFSCLAWLRVFAFTLLLWPSFTTAREESLFTSSVTYCKPPETLLISRFEVAYFPSNQSVSFNVSAASVQANINVSANLLLNVYGMKPVNVTIDLCNILDGALCPLPMYNFTGADSLTLPESLGVAGMIPGIAFKIPDLEGFAQLTLTEVSTGAVKACVQATLTNQWSTHQIAVEWTTGGVAIAAFIASVWLSVLAPDAIAPFRLLELMYLYQTIASSALLNLNYPSVYRSFALNFAWAVGLFPTSASSGMQASINRMRHLTGGKLADSSDGSAIQFVNRKLSPYNTQSAVPSLNPNGASLLRRASHDIAGSLSNLVRDIPFSHVSNLAKRDTINGEVQTVTTDSSNVLQAGLPIYVNSVHVSTANAFMTVFLCALMMFALGLALLASGYGIYIFMKRRHESSRQNRRADSEFDYRSFALSWVLRLGLIAFGPLLIFIFYQWTLKDSWLSILLSVLSFLAITALVGYPVFLTFRFTRRSSVFSMYTPEEKHLSAYGALFALYRHQRFYFFAPLLAAAFLRAIFIAFAKDKAEVQIAFMVAVELALVASHFILKPYRTKGGDVFSTFLAVVRLVCMGLLIAFLESLKVKAIPRVVIGIILVLMFSVSVIVVIVNFILHLDLQKIWKREQTSESTSTLDSTKDLQDSALELGDKSSSSGFIKAGSKLGDDLAWDQANGRPINPTPEQSTPIDSSFLQPFPISPTGTTVTSMDPPSVYTRDSGTMTVGSLLSRQWFFSSSQPTSPTGSSVLESRSRERDSLQAGGSSLGHGRESFSQRTSSNSSPMPPPSSAGSHSGVTRTSSVRVLQHYQQHHQHIPEHEPS